MKMSKDNMITLMAMDDYTSPNMPTLVEAKPQLLKKVPSRWKNKAVIAVATGIFGTTALIGCVAPTPTFTPIEDIEEPLLVAPIRMETYYCSDLHHGGSGSAPIYVAYLTEQEALGMIRNQLEAAGLTLNEVSPQQYVRIDDVYTELGNFGEVHTTFSAVENDIALHFFVEEIQMGIVVVHSWYWWLGAPCTTEVRERIIQRFWHEHGIVVHVLFDSGAGVHDWQTEEWDDEVGEWVLIEEDLNDRAYRIAEEQFTEQIQAFIRRQSQE